MYTWEIADIKSVLDRRRHAELAERLLDNHRASFREQMVSRRIRLIMRSKHLARRKLLGSMRSRQEYFIVLVDQNSSLKEQLFTIGHEIAHTYLFFPASIHGSPLLMRTYMCGDQEVGEYFCDEFARRWVNLSGGQRELRELLQEPNCRLISKVELEKMDPAELPDHTPRELKPVDEINEEDLPF